MASDSKSSVKVSSDDVALIATSLEIHAKVHDRAGNTAGDNELKEIYARRAARLRSIAARLTSGQLEL